MRAWTLVAALLLASCGGDEPPCEGESCNPTCAAPTFARDGACVASGIPTDGCASGFVWQSGECVPVLAEACEGASRPQLGSTSCVPVGIATCAPELVAVGDGSCAPKLPKDACKAGTFAVPGDTTCRPIGVDDCGTGFHADGEGGCAPDFPIDCPDGTFAVPGDVACAPAAACGTDRWPAAPSGLTALYVDASSTSVAPDGTAAQPFATIAAALAKTTMSSAVLVAAGTYDESISVAGTRIIGVCPAKVTLRGAVTLEASSSIESLSLRDGAIAVKGTASLRAVHVHDAPAIAIAPSASADLSRTLIERSIADAITVQGSLVLTDSAIRGGARAGVIVDGKAAVATLVKSRIDGQHGYGAVSQGGKLSLDRVYVHGTLLETGYASGVAAYDAGGPPSLQLTSTVVAGNEGNGIDVQGGAAVIRQVSVRDQRGADSIGLSLTAPSTVDAAHVSIAGSAGRGVVVNGGALTFEALSVVRSTGVGIDIGRHALGIGSVTGKDLQVKGASAWGIGVYAGKLDIEGAAITDVVPKGTSYGRGIQAQVNGAKEASKLTLRRTLIERVVDVGLVVWGCDATLSRSVIRDVAPGKDFGSGNAILAPIETKTKRRASLIMEDSVIERVSSMAVQVQGSTATFERVTVRDVRPRAKTDNHGRGIEAAFNPMLKIASEVTVKSSVVARVADFGLMTQGSTLVVENSIVRDVALDTATANGGAVGAFSGNPTEKVGTMAGTRLELRASLIERTGNNGVVAEGASVRIDDTVVRHVTSRQKGYGFGIVASAWTADLPGALEVDGVVVEDAASLGIALLSADGTIRRSLIQDLHRGDGALAWDGFGIGVGRMIASWGDVGPPSTWSVEGSVIRRARVAGIFAGSGTSGSVVRTTIVDTAATEDGLFGDGVQLAALFHYRDTGDAAPELAIDQSFLGRNPRAAVAAFGGTMQVSGTRLECSAFGIDVETVDATAETFSPNVRDGGGVFCGCGTGDKCLAQSASLRASEGFGGVGE